MNVIRTAVYPPFLRHLDERLLLTRPALWATKVHRVAWLSGLLCLIAVGLAFILPTAEIWRLPRALWSAIVPLTIAEIALLVYALHGSNRYRVEREYGDRDAVHDPKAAWAEIGTTLLTVLLVGSSMVFFLAVARHRLRVMDNPTFAAHLFLADALSGGKINGYELGYGVSRSEFSDAEWIQHIDNHLEQELLGSPDTISLVNAYAYPFERMPVNRFLYRHLEIATLAPFIVENELQTDAFLAWATGYSSDEIARLKTAPPWSNRFARDFRPIRNYGNLLAQANYNTNVVFGLSYSPVNPAIVALQVLATAAAYISLWRFTARYVSKATRLRLILVAGILFAFITFVDQAATMFGPIWYLDNLRDGIVYGQRWGHFATDYFDDYPPRIIISVTVLAYTAFVAWSSWKLPKFGRFTFQFAQFHLALLPFLLALAPFALVAFIEGLIGWRSFISWWWSTPSTILLVLTRMLFLTQFVWLLTIPFLKKQHIRLLSQPRD